MIALTLVVSATLTFLAGLHIYWACGGSWAGQIVLPKKEDGRALFSPGPGACFAVAFGLFAIAAFCVTCLFSSDRLPFEATIYWILASVFALRVIGDFRYIGVFRKVRHTDFARMDRAIYSPLCAAYSAAFFTFAIA